MSDQERTILLNDIDAAGVVFYARAMAMAHEAYELAMASQGISFADMIRAGAIALPVVHARADFQRPLRHGNRVRLRVYLQEVGVSSYQITIAIMLDAAVAVTVTQVHAHLDLATRRAVPLSPELLAALRRLEPAPAAAERPRGA